MNVRVVAILVFLLVDGAEALKDSEVCYILDGILFLYGIILTILYCRLKFQDRKKNKTADPSAIYEKVEGIYTGLDAQEMQPYSTLQASEKAPEGLPPRKTPSEE
ncbi:high affinity immunoglobulin epsilon receptor subunit gamma-like [Pseudonaja textilis]|uniref:high affinity immunoglobulin epsilon receptor subunit gamma-like n=1 Tax=Pseudonaja textilis TaxID=8673 RepID=UPI000EA8A38B|nr:high affinity immunoglobulin epsilon receptor subunit gamma-like [Pseudonaja textilis]XP_026580186.1 high affinity immunoglobulin epsilon receptor subunit gamma-like [Pseudonaja textilis]